MATELDYMEYANDAAAQAAYVTNSSVGSNEITTNPDFETWSGGDNVAPDGWTLYGSGAAVVKESTIKVIGNYSAKITAGGDGQMIQDFSAAKGMLYWQGRTITMGAWVYATGGKRACIGLYDAVAATNSPYHPGDGVWRYLTVTHTVSIVGTTLWARLLIVDTATTAYFDGAIVVDSPYIYSLQSYFESTIKTQGSYALKGVATITASLNKTLTRTIT